MKTPEQTSGVSFEIKRWLQSAGTEIVRHIFVVTFPTDDDEIFLDT